MFVSCGRSRAAFAILALALGRCLDLAAQNPPSYPSSSRFVSRFIPAEVWARMRERLEDPKTSVVVDAPVDTVWTALRAALDGLEVPVGFAERSTWEMGSQRVKLYRMLGKQRLSSYVRCGEGITGPNADSYVVYLSFLSFLRPEADGKVILFSLLAAQAIDLPNGRNDVVDCTSTGRLEQRVAEQVLARLKSASKE